jgi:hypothetical protein
VLLGLPRLSGIRGKGPRRDLRLLDAWLAREPVRDAIGVNVADDEEWLDRDRFARLLTWAARLDAIETGAPPDTAFADRLTAAADEADYRIDRLRAALSAPAPKGRSRQKGLTPRQTPPRRP